FDKPIKLILTHPIYGVSIRYTTDGSEPALNNGLIYFAPVTISNSTPVRAAAFKSGFLPSTTVTHTYLFPAQTMRQPNNPAGYPTGATVMGGYPADYEMDPEIVNNPAYASSVVAALRALPAVSMVTSIDNMFGATNGIYTHISEDQALFRGVAWERACSIEFLPNDGSTGFQINCGVRMQGNASRNPQKTPKHPFRLLFKNDYGPGRLDAKVFPDSPVQSFNTLVMRADFNNSWLHWNNAQRDRGTRIRDAWAKDTWRAMGQPGSHSRYFHLYINGIYWGIYDFGERIDATMAANYLGGEPEEYDAVASKPVKAVDGDLVAFNAMSAAVKSRSQATLSNYQAVLQLLDVDNFADYMILNFYGANQDWGNDSNWNAIRRRNPAGKFQFVSWDGEQLIVAVGDNRVANADVPAGLHTSLVNSPEYRLTFADRAHKHFFNGGAMSTNAVAARWSARAAEVSTAIIAESARWGDYRRDVHPYQTAPYILYTRDLGTTNWLAEVNRLLTSYFPQRGGIFLNQLRAAGLYPNVDAPSFNQQGGVVARGFNLTMSAANPVYYTLDGSDPRMFGTGAVSPTASLYAGPVTLNSSAAVKARALSGTNWSALNAASFTIQILSSPLRITEIMYNPIGGDAYEYLELQNIGPSLLDVSGQSIDAIAYAFPPNTILQPGQVIVLGSATSPGNWAARYPGVNVFGRFTGKLDNAGEKLAIVDGSGATLWSVDYDDENGWPREADGLGYSLEIIDPLGDPDNPANWRASASSTGTPGSVTPPPPAGIVTINEVMAENISAVQNAGMYPDWVELRNSSGGAVNLAGWSLSDDSNPRKFVFPAGTSIAAGGFLVVWCDTNSVAPGLHTQFALSRDGDSVFLYDANTNRMDAVGFGLQLANQTIGRVASVWTLTQPTPGTANLAAGLSPSSNLSINEWLADSVPGGDDWIELYNRGGSPVALGGVYLAVGGSIQSLAPLSFIGAQGYVQLLADENPGATHLDFKLPAGGGSIVLSSEAGTELERINYGPQTQGITQGRLPDGTATIVLFPTSQSPGAANYALSYNGPLLNEVLAINRSAVTNTMGRTADFVELYNPGAAPFDLSGLRLSNTPDEPAQWTFPVGTVIPANGYVVVWFDEELPAATATGAFLNTGHSLDGESGEVWLFNGSGQPVDSVVFGFQVVNLSIGRVPGAGWNLLSGSTPGAVNAPAAAVGSASGLRLNEWLANSPSGDDWFELFNLGLQPVSLQDLLVSDRPNVDAAPFRLPPLSFVGAKGFVRLKADGNPSNGRNHVDFSLDGEGESLWVSSAALGLIDSISFGTQPAGVAEGRLPDGTANVVSFPVSSTPGESNYEPWRDVVINEVIPRAIGADNAIELRNVTGVSVSLN
ncbi:MAG TPA: lamin tail domain-containing protein, partial [Verrucomicrobiae bacterium]|nr:lamin tail domain-containing protein [Verrucomicrobiae bacterium]